MRFPGLGSPAAEEAAAAWDAATAAGFDGGAAYSVFTEYDLWCGCRVVLCDALRDQGLLNYVSKQCSRHETHTPPKGCPPPPLSPSAGGPPGMEIPRNLDVEYRDEGGEWQRLRGSAGRFRDWEVVPGVSREYRVVLADPQWYRSDG